jgi:DNA-binding transcriptional regulator LsrR (DeoR family)
LKKKQNIYFNNGYLDTNEAMARISWYYYKQDMTKTAIAKKMNTNRIKIMKILERARDREIVNIRIKGEYQNILEIERNLIQKFELIDAMVIPYPTSGDLNTHLGVAAAQYISTVLKNGDILGIGWGDSVSKTIRHLSLEHLDDFYLISLTGGVLSFIYEGEFFGKYSKFTRILPAPLLVSNEKVAKVIYEESEVRVIMNMWNISNYALIGIGALNPQATILRERYITEDEFALLRQRGTVGDILGQFFDAYGKRIPYSTDKRLIAYPIEKLKNVPNVIAVAGGEYKVKAMYAALLGGYTKILVTDEKTANMILELQ